MFLTLDDATAFLNERKKLGIKPGLERIKKLLHMLEHPEKKIRAIHVAGTNGKGSTIHFIQAALQANGHRTGLFTSPSFHGTLGYIFLNGKIIDEKDFLAILNEIYPHIKTLDDAREAPTEFEILTVIAFQFFAKKSDIVLIETGMGGRYDTTNICQPILSIITNVSRDHTEYLGESLVEIAYHKAGIIKNQVPVIVGDLTEDAMRVIMTEALQKNTHVYKLFEDFTFTSSFELNKIMWESGGRKLSLSLEMKGEHQFKNVSLALKAVEQLERNGISIHWHKAVQAMEQLTLPGRFEVFHQQPLVIADAAHNLAGIESFIKTVTQYDLPKKHVVVAVFADKEVESMLQELSKHFDMVTVTTFPHPRAASTNDLFEKIRKENKRKVDDWEKEIESLLEKEETFYITGSLHFITLVRSYFVKNSTDL